MTQGEILFPLALTGPAYFALAMQLSWGMPPIYRPMRFFNIHEDQLLKEVTLLIFIPFLVGLLVVGFIGAVIWGPLGVAGLFVTGVWGGLKTRRELQRATDGPLSWVILTFPFLPMKRPMLLFDIWTVTLTIAITAFMFAAMAV